MSRSITVLFALVAAVGSAVPLIADNAPTPTPASSASPAAPASGAAPGVATSEKAPEPFPQAPAAPKAPRPFSPEVAAALAEGMPKFNPPTPTPVVNEPQDMRDVDKPKNEIHRLPAYVVQGQRSPVFQKRDLDTHDSLVSLSYKLHPGLGFGNLLGLNNALAFQMELEQERLDDIADLTDTAHAMSLGGDRAEGAYILKETQETYLRPPDDWTFGGPGGGLTGSGSK